jgi:hypothetical protein
LIEGYFSRYVFSSKKAFQHKKGIFFGITLKLPLRSLSLLSAMIQNVSPEEKAAAE